MLFFLEVTCSLCICIRLSARLPHGSRLLADPVTLRHLFDLLVPRQIMPDNPARRRADRLRCIDL
jgi:hypothetical protein